MAFNTIEIKSKLDSETIIQIFKTNTYSKNGTWNVNEFNNKHTVEKTYTFENSNNTFTLRARKTNQRRQSRPFGYGEIIQGKKNTIIHITIIPHIGSIIAWLIFFSCSIMGLLQSIINENYFSIIPCVLISAGLCVYYFLSLKYDTKDMHIFVQKILKQNQ